MTFALARWGVSRHDRLLHKWTAASSPHFLYNPLPNPPQNPIKLPSPIPPAEMTLGERTLSIDVEETAEGRIQRLISENPVIIFSRSSCCMCHVMKRLLASIGVHPTVIELDDDEIEKARSVLTATVDDDDRKPDSIVPAVFIGGALVGGLEGLMGLHLSGHLVPKLKEVGWL
ncbi:putative thioredoxin superfamily protein [Cinnamomum micranthum f. kanehirae]|uniref:Putative thioredoxin superfamily protein n=1 Tax=Cinnamomum micranthum f. kanehirae TaxID=337451 RepID=A0A3S3MZR5_9MAGN|nr:putative thioredoxin superfamily protein [Cinnamomum micranthum f. kanehirae]